MACEDTRQLTEAQRQAAYQQQRTGVPQAVRPFTGTPTIGNLLDYINRELVPAVRQTRSAVNDVYLQVADNAPSANPLGYYFSSETGAADPTSGRVRLNASPQNTSTVLRISQTNARLADVLPWLDVMAGSVTEPLGVVTLADAVNPGRFIRADLDTMTDQGAYWDLGLTITESSHPDPFVDAEAVTLAFIPGVADNEGLGALIPPASITPIATDTFLGNITGSTAAPTATPLASIDSTSITYDAASHEFRRAALTGFAAAAANTNATTSAEPIVTFSASANMSNERVTTSSTSVTVDIATAGQIEFQRAALTGFATATANSNATSSAEPIVTYTASANMSAERVLSNGTNTTVSTAVANQISVGVDDLPLSALADQAAGTVVANITASSAPPTAHSLTTLAGAGLTYTNVTGIMAVGAGTGITVAADAVGLTDMAGGTVKGRQIDAATGAPVDLTGLEVGELLRSGTRQAVTLAAQADNQTLNDDTTVLRVTPTGSQTLTGMTGGSDGRLVFIENIAGSGNNLTLASLSASSLTANRIRTPNGLDLILKFRETALARWDANSNDWRIVATSRATAVADADYGDITVSSNATVWTIDNDAVTNAKLANMGAGTVKGVQLDGSTGDPQDLTGDEIAEMLRWNTVVTDTTSSGAQATYTVADITTQVLVNTAGTVEIQGISIPARVGQRVTFNRQVGATAAWTFRHNSASAGATQQRLLLSNAQDQILGDCQSLTLEYTNNRWRQIAGSTTALTDGDKGDITVSSSGTVWTIDNDVVTNAKAANMASPSLKGRTTASTGDPEDLTLVGSTSVTWNTSTGGSVSLERAALTGDVTASANSNATTIAAGVVTNAKLATMGTAGTVKGIQIDASVPAAPVDLTGAEVAELLRYSTTQGATIAATTNDFSLNADATVLRLTSTTGAQTVTGITGGVAGRILSVENVSGSGNAITLASLDAGSLTANRIRTPNAAPFVLGFRESALLRWDATNGDWRLIAAARAVAVNDADYGDITVTGSGTTWTIDAAAVTLAKMENRAAGTVIGRQIDASTGPPVALTGLELGENLKIDTRIDDASTSGTSSPYVLSSTDTNWVRFTALTGAYTLNGCDPATSGRLVVWHVEPGTTGTLVFTHNSGAVSTGFRFFCPGAATLTIGPGDTVVTLYTSNRHRVISVTRQGFALTDSDKGDITVSSSGATFTIDNDVVSNAKAANMATARLKGRTTSGTGDPEDLTLTDSTTVTWNATSGGTISLERAALSGDVTAAANGNATTIASGAVSLAKMADLAQSRIIGRAEGGGTGTPQALTPTQVVSIIDGETVAWSGEHTFNEAVEVANELRLSGIDQPSIGVGAINNLSINAVSVLWLNFGATDQQIRGIVPPTASENQLLVVINITLIQGVLVHNSGSATAGNRILCPNATNYVLRPFAATFLWYDTTQWWVIAGDRAEALASQMEAGIDSDVVVTPAMQHRHPSAAKCWGFTTGGGTPVLNAQAYNMTSITDTAAGTLTVTIATDFSSASYTAQATHTNTGARTPLGLNIRSKAAGSFIIDSSDNTWAASDPSVGWDWVAFGDQ